MKHILSPRNVYYLLKGVCFPLKDIASTVEGDMLSYFLGVQTYTLFVYKTNVVSSDVEDKEFNFCNVSAGTLFKLGRPRIRIQLYFSISVVMWSWTHDQVLSLCWKSSVPAVCYRGSHSVCYACPYSFCLLFVRPPPREHVSTHDYQGSSHRMPHPAPVKLWADWLLEATVESWLASTAAAQVTCPGPL